MSIGKILKTMRNEKNLTQLQIGELIGYARNTISQYESEILQPEFSTIQKIAKECDYEIIFKNVKTNKIITVDDINKLEI